MVSPLLRVRVALASLALAASPCGLRAQQLNFITAVDLGAAGNGEVLSYTADNHTLLSTNSSAGVQVFNFTGTGVSARTTVNFSSLGTFADVSSVAADPLGRGFGVATLLPTSTGTTGGTLALFDYNTGSVLGALTVGFHPDNVIFSNDGSKLFVANEGERTTGGDTDAPGSLSIVDLGSFDRSLANAGLAGAHVRTFTFEPTHLAAGVSATGLRFNDSFSTGNAHRHIEPEYITQVGSSLFVSLQENNGIGEFDLTTEKWVGLENMGTRTITIDSSDRDGPGGTATAQIDDSVKALPMPDTIGSYSVGGQSFLVTANEGDFRGDDADRARVSELLAAGKLDLAHLNGVYGTGFTANAKLGRLRVSTIDGDIDSDGLIEELTAAGSRGFSIINADTGELVFDSGSLEQLLFSLDPTRHNIDAENPGNPAIDVRSTSKGPEPEALRIFELSNGSTYLALGMERQYGILLYDITNPTTPVLMDYINTFGLGGSNPLAGVESMVFIPGSQSPDGVDYLVAGFEYSGDLAIFAIPEPSTYAALLGLAVAGAVALRRRARRSTTTA